MSANTASHIITQPAATLAQRVAAACFATVLGAGLVYFAGFSHLPTVHNAAHDTRHSAAFPCH
jgi:cobalt transporter subunit CbtB